MGESAQDRPKGIYRKPLAMHENEGRNESVEIREICGDDLQRPERSRLTRSKPKNSI
jgi:hypothetical protein